MTPLALGGLLGLGLLLLGSEKRSSRASNTNAASKSDADVAKQIVDEAREIVNGNRGAFSDDGLPSDDDDDLRAAAEQGAALHAAETASDDAGGAGGDDDDAGGAGAGGDDAPQPIQTTSVPAPSGSVPIPSGYDPEGARRMVPSVVNNLRNKGRLGYDRQMLKSFQTKAGITPDRFYGGETRGALLYFGGANVPPPFLEPLDTIRYVPPEQRTV